LTAVAGNAGGDCGRDEKTARQPNQKTRKMTAIFGEPRSNGIDTEMPVTEARDNEERFSLGGASHKLLREGYAVEIRAGGRKKNWTKPLSCPFPIGRAVIRPPDFGVRLISLIRACGQRALSDD
jgi:hypothetical protein